MKPLNKLLVTTALTLAAISATSANAATVVTSNGIVTGVNGVAVGNATYNVAFSNLCDEAFGDCTNSANFDFSSAAAADAALTALYSQAFAGSSITQALGCNSASNCYAIIPFAAAAGNITASYKSLVDGGLASGVSIPVADYGNGSYAKFTSATAAVPEPATWALMILGMGAVGFAMRRRKNVNMSVRFA